MLFRRTPKSHPMSFGEQALLAETLIGASFAFADNTPLNSALQLVCDDLVAATPHLTLAWVWLGAPGSPFISPQIAAGPAEAYAKSLRLERTFITQLGPAFRALSGDSSQVFSISKLSPFAPWRSIASEYDVKSVLVVPIRFEGSVKGLLALYSVRQDVFDPISVGLFEALAQLMWRVIRKREQQPLMSEMRSDASQTDSLTGFPTRSHMLALLRDCWQVPPRDDNRGVVMLVAIEDYSQITAAEGQHVIDMATKHVSESIRHAFRPTDVVGRWSDDKFLVWLPAMRADQAYAAGKLVQERVAELQTQELGRVSETLRIAVGGTAAPASMSLQATLDTVDQALTRARRQASVRIRIEAQPN